MMDLMTGFMSGVQLDLTQFHSQPFSFATQLQPLFIRLIKKLIK